MSFYNKTVNIIRQIPYGKVATYRQLALLAGNPKSARQVAWILHSSSGKESLPWHRIINSKGMISLKPGYGYELQKKLLEDEGIVFDEKNIIDLCRYSWNGYTC